MSEGSKFFEGEGSVQAALRKITTRLDELGIPYSVVGGLALFQHGYRRFTEDVDILVTRDGLKKIHAAVVGLGWRPAFEGAKNLRDTEFGVKIEFLRTGDYPGDGKPKPISFPDPAAVGTDFGGIKYLNLPTLVELKLASGMDNPARQRDLVDVGELVKVLRLPRAFVEQLNPFVQAEYLKIWDGARPVKKRYLQLWRNKWLTAGAKNIDDMIEMLEGALSTLKGMRADGVTLDPKGGTEDDYAHLVTTDPGVAQKYGMEDESEFFDDDIPDEEV